MENEAAYIATLIGKSRRGRLTEAEAGRLEAWLEASDRNRQLFSELQSESAQWEAMAMMHTYRQDDIRTRILAIARDKDRPSSGIRRIRKWVPYAAAIFLAATAATLIYQVGNWQLADGNLAATEILPGGNRATLTLADGRTVDLSEAQTGIVIGDGITYLDGSTVFGERGNEGTSEPVQGSERNHKLTSSPVHTLTTPKGGTYQITLPDGTKVWLNAASTLKYPSRFDEEERIVELIGEAFFDVRHETLDVRHEIANGRNDPVPERHLKSQISSLKSDGRPFWVVSKGQRVEVLGTQFNISAYPDDPETKTTLVEGSVRLSLARELSEASPVPDQQVVLVPGEQGRLADDAIDVKQVDVNQFIAWRHGRFDFTDRTLEEALRQLGRWYDLDVTYEGSAPRIEFYGTINRNQNFETVLKLLDNNGVSYRLSGRSLTIVGGNAHPTNPQN